MFADIFIHFILNNKLITEQHAKEVLTKRISKVRPAILAVYEKMITEEQAKKIMALQKAEDMPFEYLASREKLLSDEQLLSLLGRQTSDDTRLMQILSDKGYMSMDAVLLNLEAFKNHYNLTDEMYDGIVQNKPESYVSFIADVKDDFFASYATVLITTFISGVTPSFRIGKAYKTTSIDYKYIIKVNCYGDRKAVIGFAFNNDDTVLNYASRFYKQRMHKFNEDVEDSLKELLNLVAGLFISTVEKEFNLDIDIEVPELTIGDTIANCGDINAIDAFSLDGDFTFFMILN